MRFSYTQPLSKPEVSEINKHIRNMTKINAASNTANHSYEVNMEALMESSGIKLSGSLRLGNVNFEMLSKAW